MRCRFAHRLASSNRPSSRPLFGFRTRSSTPLRLQCALNRLPPCERPIRRGPRTPRDPIIILFGSGYAGLGKSKFCFLPRRLAGVPTCGSSSSSSSLPPHGGLSPQGPPDNQVASRGSGSIDPGVIAGSRENPRAIRGPGPSSFRQRSASAMNRLASLLASGINPMRRPDEGVNGLMRPFSGGE
jgi:hypothetical protein